MTKEQIAISIIDLVVRSSNILVIIVIAILGWHQWKIQWLKKSRYEFASSMIDIVYDLNSSVGTLRERFYPYGEIVTVLHEQKKEISKTHAIFVNQGIAAIIRKRLRNADEKYNEVIRNLFKAEMILDIKIDEKFATYSEAYQEVRSVAYLLIKHYEIQAINKKTSIKDNDNIKVYEGILYKGYPDQNKIDIKFEEGFNKFKKEMRPFLKLEK